MENTIANLRNFSQLDLHSKEQLINKGRPMPVLMGLQRKRRKKKTRLLQSDLYQRHNWLCGCATRNRLYCFPCLLFSTTDDDWTNAGFGDFQNLSEALNEHRISSTHIQCCILLHSFEGSSITQAFNEQRKLNISIHNAKVKENREMLKNFITPTCFVALRESAFFGKDKHAVPSYHGAFVDLLHILATWNEKLAKHLEISTVFSDLAGIQNTLVEAVADVLRNDIKEEIKAAPFVALEVDETTDLANEPRLSVILRYVDKSEVKEAFLGFDDVIDRRAPAIADYVLGVLQKYDCVEKLVAHTYDGASVMASDLNEVQAKIKEKVPEAKFIHCYAHNLTQVLIHSAKCIPECQDFFNVVDGLAEFFSMSTKRVQLLDEVVKQRLPGAEPIKWSSYSRLVQTISMYQSDLRDMFMIMNEKFDDWDIDTRMLAVGFDLLLSKASTCFLLMAFEGIFEETGALFHVLQNKILDVGFCCTQVRNTMGFLERQRNNFDSLYDQFQQRCLALGLTDDNQSKDLIKGKRRILFFNILDNIDAQMKARFDHFDELAFLGLVDCSKFSELAQHFKLQSLPKYGRYFNLKNLKAHLFGLYTSDIVRNECRSPAQLLSFLVTRDLTKTVPEAIKLLQLVFTIPATTPSTETPCSALKRLKTYVLNRNNQGGPSSLAIISIEKERLTKLKENKEDFYNKVIEIFAQKDGRMDFIYM